MSTETAAGCSRGRDTPIGRQVDVVVVYDPDLEMSPDHRAAVADVVAAIDSDKLFDDDQAVRRRVKARLRVVRPALEA
jgi:hypothetical protein